ncbi:hypothetical protein JCM10212_001253 [Sporobolomyces blumeae]
MSGSESSLVRRAGSAGIPSQGRNATSPERETLTIAPTTRRSPPPASALQASVEQQAHSTKRVARHEPVREAQVHSAAQAAPVLFTNLNPFASLPYDVTDPGHSFVRARRESAELRAFAANQIRFVTFEDGHGKRRKSVIEVEWDPIDAGSNRRCSLKGERRRSSACQRRRQSSLTPIQTTLPPKQEPAPRMLSPVSPDLPSSPFSPTLSDHFPVPAVERRDAFCDESPVSPLLSPISASGFSSVSSPNQSPAPSFSSTFSTTSARLHPRSPRTFSFSDVDPDETVSRSRRGSTRIQSPSGVRIKYPLVFPSAALKRASVAVTQVDVAGSSGAPIEATEREAPSKLVEEASGTGRTCETPLASPSIDARRARLRLPSPFPPPLISMPPAPASFHRSADADFTCDPPCDSSGLGRLRQDSLASSYHSSPHEHPVGTPNTLCFARTPLQTSTSNHMVNVFAESFGDALSGVGGPSS